MGFIRKENAYFSMTPNHLDSWNEEYPINISSYLLIAFIPGLHHSSTFMIKEAAYQTEDSTFYLYNIFTVKL